MITRVDRFPVVFTMYNNKGEVIFREERVIALSSIMACSYAYSITKPDGCVRLTVDIAFPAYSGS